MSVWSIGSLDEEEQKKKLMGAMPTGFGGPESVAVQEGVGTTALKAGGKAVGTKIGTTAGAAIGSAFGPLGTIAGGAIGGALGGSLLGGGSGAPTAPAPKFDGGDLVNKQADTSVTIPTQQVAQGPLSLNQEAAQRAFDEEEYMKRFGGRNYAV